MKIRNAALLLVSLWGGSVFAETEREADRWNLQAIYPDVAAWETAYKDLEQRLQQFKSCEGHLADSAKQLRVCLDQMNDASKELARVTSYASMKYDENTKVSKNLELDQRGNLLITSFSQAVSFVDPELLSIGEKRIKDFIKEESALKVYAHHLDDVLRRAKHTGTAGEESIIATAGLVTDAPYTVYGILANADMPWPTIKLSDGSEVTLDQSGYGRYRGSLNRDDRKKVFDAFWGTWNDYTRTFGVTLNAQVKRDVFYAKVRHYPNALAASLDANNIPQTVYRTLISETNANLDTLHRYFKLRKRMLGVKEMHYYDIYPPLVDSDKSFTIDQAKALLLDAFKPLGKDYVATVDKGFKNRWMDVYPRPGKRSGAYSNGAVYDVNPYILMNYNGDYDAVSTLAHEWGHGMHSYLANKAQPFATADYSIFLAEIASTFNEALLLEKMLKEAKNDEERLFYLGSALEQLRGTFYRQAMFAEFELKIHELVEQGEALSGDRLTAVYGDILKRYHGHDQGIVIIDDLYTREWAYIPHFYYNFYVYQYATSISASALLSDRVMQGEPGALDNYLNLLKAGNKDYPYDLLKKAGVDLASPAPYRAIVKRMNGIMDKIEAILAKKK